MFNENIHKFFQKIHFQSTDVQLVRKCEQNVT